MGSMESLDDGSFVKDILVALNLVHEIWRCFLITFDKSFKKPTFELLAKTTWKHYWDIFVWDLSVDSLYPHSCRKYQI